jgi:hypothetical protein
LRAYLSIVIVLACIQAGSFIAVAISAGVTIPIIDILHITGSYLRHGFSWSWLVELLNQHSIILPRLLLLADMSLTGGHMVIIIALALASWCAVFTLVLRHVAAVAADNFFRGLAGALLAMAMFRGFLLESIVLNNGFNYPLTAIFVVMAATAVAGIVPSQPVLVRTSIAALSGLAAGLCLVNGLLVIPIVALMAWLRSRSPVALLPFVVTGIAGLWLYWLGSERTSFLIAIEPGVFFQTLLNLFGAPWVRKIGIAGQIVGIVVIVAAAGSLVATARRYRHCNGADAMIVILILFGLGSTGMVAIGRLETSEAIGSAGRYGLWVAFVHAGIILAAVQSPAVRQWASAKTLRIFLLAGIFLLIVEQARYAVYYTQLGEEMQAAATELQAGGRSMALLQAIRSPPDYALPALDLFAEQHLYGFGLNRR